MKQTKKKYIIAINKQDLPNPEMYESLGYFMVRSKWHVKNNQWFNHGLTTYLTSTQTYTRKQDAFRGLNRYIKAAPKAMQMQLSAVCQVMEVDW